jgi:hypothetical protein
MVIYNESEEIWEEAAVDCSRINVPPRTLSLGTKERNSYSQDIRLSTEIWVWYKTFLLSHITSLLRGHVFRFSIFSFTSFFRPVSFFLLSFLLLCSLSLHFFERLILFSFWFFFIVLTHTFLRSVSERVNQMVEESRPRKGRRIMPSIWNASIWNNVNCICHPQLTSSFGRRQNVACCWISNMLMKPIQ